MSRLVVVSNRVPPINKDEASAGGLATGLRGSFNKTSGVWLGWSGEIAATSQGQPKIRQAGGVTYATFGLTRQDYEEYYNGFANRILWPLFHYHLDLTEFRPQYFAAYLRGNALFAKMLVPLLKPNDIVWIHDYHLIPLGEKLRCMGITQPLGFFLHTPFPAPEIMVTLPDHRSLLRSLFAYDVVGFQTKSDLRAFCDYIVHEAKGEILDNGRVQAFDASVRVGVFPISIDTAQIARLAKAAASSQPTQRLKKSLLDRGLIIGVDRLDYSKGLVERFEAFERLIKTYPENRGRITLMQIAPSSRSEVPEYLEIRRLLQETAGSINSRLAELDWVPIRYLNRRFNRRTLCGFFRVSRIGLVTPLRDGMNLVAKEFVAAQTPNNPGVLVLSRFAGAAQELDAALVVNPYDIEEVSKALQRAIEMPLAERRERWKAMMSVLRRNDVEAWRRSFIRALCESREAA